ncbi:pyrrolo-quinoline quinone [Tistrella bauzanensis]|uniref:Pyrrolo-quinoline quinone n=1 Tax=Tistrella bauzanensis TaxID=657419 RepID=A0ABQ1IT16_9PROT|nr:PQQ-binding-like beta-propeller repeat protein [Tistrella bauzanensis]GGB50413.1 pyrrolo-quinoline quinone [Tistrella bauzanensis]
MTTAQLIPLRSSVSGRRPARSAGLAMLTMLLLSGCGSWWGSDEKPTLGGERIAVMPERAEIRVDPAVAAEPVSLPPAYQNGEWPQTGGYGNHAMHALIGPAAPVEAWRSDAGEGSGGAKRLMAQPVMADGRIFTLDADSAITAMDAATGNRLWTVELAPDDDLLEGAYGGGVVLSGGKLFAATGFGDVVALQPSDGVELWRTSLRTPFRAPPAAGDGRLYAQTFDNQLIAFNAEDGRELWRHGGVPATQMVLGGAAPGVLGNLVVAAYSSGDLVALRGDSGRVGWAETLAGFTAAGSSLSALTDILSDPIIDREMVIAGTVGGRLAAFDARSGLRVWEQPFKVNQTPWVADTTIYAVVDGTRVVALRRADGRVRWVSDLPAFEDPEDREDPIRWTGPVMAGGRLHLVSTSGQLMSLDPADGARTGEIDVGGPVMISPVVAGGMLYVLRDDATLVAAR